MMPPVLPSPGNLTTAEDTPLGIPRTDADGDSLTYTLVVNSGDVVTACVSGSDVSMIRPTGTNLTATVDDGANRLCEFRPRRVDAHHRRGSRH